MSDISKVVDLPDYIVDGNLSVEEAINKRRSVRTYSDDSLKLEDVSQLLWSAQGITNPESNYRSAPSAGGTFPLQVYLVVPPNGVKDLKKGLYKYQPNQHQLKKINNQELCKELKNHAQNQKSIEESAINIILTAKYENTTSTYGDRGIRYVHMEIGHVGQNIHLQAEALKLKTVMIGAFNDKKIQKTLELPKNQKPLYIVPIGHPKT